MNDLKDFPKKLKFLRKAKNLTQEELAEKLKTTKQAISHYELGKREPSLNFIIELSNFFNCSIDELIYDYSKNLNLSYLDEILKYNPKGLDKEKLLEELIEKEKDFKEYELLISKKLDELNSLIKFLKNDLDLEKNDIEFYYKNKIELLKHRYSLLKFQQFLRPIKIYKNLDFNNEKFDDSLIDDIIFIPNNYLDSSYNYFILDTKFNNLNKLFTNNEKLLIKQSYSAIKDEQILAYVKEQINDNDNSEIVTNDFENDKVILINCNSDISFDKTISNNIHILGTIVSTLDVFLKEIDLKKLEKFFNKIS